MLKVYAIAAVLGTKILLCMSLLVQSAPTSAEIVVGRHGVPKMMRWQGAGGCSEPKECLHFPGQQYSLPGAAVEQLGAGCIQHRDCNLFALQLFCSCQGCYWKTVFFQSWLLSSEVS